MVVEHEDLRKLALRPHRMHLELAEMPADRDMLLGRQMLVAYDDDLVLDQGGFERLECRRLMLLLEVEPMDFRAEPRAQALNLERRFSGRSGCLVAGNIDVHALLPGSLSMLIMRLSNRHSKAGIPPRGAGHIALTGGATAR
jgi:hypothetical protein